MKTTQPTRKPYRVTFEVGLRATITVHATDEEEATDLAYDTFDVRDRGLDYQHYHEDITDIEEVAERRRPDHG